MTFFGGASQGVLRDVAMAASHEPAGHCEKFTGQGDSIRNTGALLGNFPA
jgi:hypothetical protein